MATKINQTRRIYSFVFGGIAAVLLFLLFGVWAGEYGAGAVLGVMGFTLVSCLILDNNFIGEMIDSIRDFGFVSFPGLIFELSLDGVIWLLTVKLLFWIIGILLAVLFLALGLILGAVLSVFTYPYAIMRSYKVDEGAFDASDIL